MNCPRCGYARSDFDIYCLRCRLMADQRGHIRPVPPAEQTVIMSDMPGLLSSPADRLSSPWAFALLAAFLVLAGFLLWHLTVAPQPQASARLTTVGGTHTAS